MCEYNLYGNYNSKTTITCVVSTIDNTICIFLLVGRKQFWVKSTPTNHYCCPWNPQC
jgi:hypothetical protein